MKTLRMNQTVYEATQQYPELIDIIASCGFPQVRNAALRNTLGRRFTISQALAQLGPNRNKILETLKSRGFQIIP